MGDALEVVQGSGTYPLSTQANRLDKAPLDEPLKASAYPSRAAVRSNSTSWPV